MDQPSLEQLVTNEAKSQASSLIDSAEHETLQYTTKEKARLASLHQEQKQKLTAEFESKKSFLFFTMESDFKKKLLQKRQSLMNQLAITLHKNFLEMIRLKPNLFLKKTISQLTSKNGELKVSKELSGIITNELIQQFNQETKSAFEFAGVDPQLEPGIAVLKGTTRYIYSLQEFIDAFLEKNHSDITKLMQF
jgi:vacuolar-type H+-ATPase subunit E/Vma4